MWSKVAQTTFYFGWETTVRKGDIGSCDAPHRLHCIRLRLTTLLLNADGVDHFRIADHFGPYLWIQINFWSALEFVFVKSVFTPTRKQRVVHSWLETITADFSSSRNFKCSWHFAKMARIRAIIGSRSRKPCAQWQTHAELLKYEFIVVIVYGASNSYDLRWWWPPFLHMDLPFPAFIHIHHFYLCHPSARSFLLIPVFCKRQNYKLWDVNYKPKACWNQMKSIRSGSPTIRRNVFVPVRLKWLIRGKKPFILSWSHKTTNT